MPDDTNRTYRVEEPEAGERLDLFLAGRDPTRSRSYFSRLVHDGHVRVDGRPRKVSFRLEAGSLVSVTHPAPQPLDLEPEAIPLSVVYEDDSLIVVDKPPGMVVHPGAGNRSGTLVHALLAHCGSLSVAGGVTRPGIVHRLDKGTSGLIVVAKDEPTHYALARQFSSRRVWKEYRALVWGHPEPPQGTIDAPIGRHARDRKKMAVREGAGREAVTKYKVLDFLPSIGYIGLKLETGRTHQIRVHLSFRRWPVVGDPLYGGRRGKGGTLNRDEGRILSLFDRPALHASYIRFAHPASRQIMEFEAPLPEDFAEALRILDASPRPGRCFD